MFWIPLKSLTMKAVCLQSVDCPTPVQLLMLTPEELVLLEIVLFVQLVMLAVQLVPFVHIVTLLQT